MASDRHFIKEKCYVGIISNFIGKMIRLESVFRKTYYRISEYKQKLLSINFSTRIATNNRDISLPLEMFHFTTYTIKLTLENGC